jgi:hypothetical protein
MNNENKQFGERFNSWYHENHDNKLDDLPDYFNRTPQTEIKYKFFWLFILLLIIAGLLIYILSQF